MKRMAKQIAEMQDWEAVAADQAMTIAMMQCEQEPVAWMVTYGGLINIVYTQPTQVVDTHYQPLYASPSQAVDE